MLNSENLLPNMKKLKKNSIELTPELVEQTRIMFSKINPELYKKFTIPNSKSE